MSSARGRVRSGSIPDGGFGLIPSDDVPNNNKVMIDIETLGTEPGCVVLSVGAVRFDRDGSGDDDDDQFYRSVDRDSCEAVGLTVDEDTLSWWLDQDPLIRRILDGGQPLDDVLDDLARFVGDAEEVWAHSPKFDALILESAYEAIDSLPPWEYYQLRDARTVDKLPVDVKSGRDDDLVNHNALDDAIEQAGTVARVLQYLHTEDDTQ